MLIYLPSILGTHPAFWMVCEVDLGSEELEELIIQMHKAA